MTHGCTRYDSETISRFSDRELPEKEYEEMKRHMEKCGSCRTRADEFHRISRSMGNRLYRETQTLPKGLLEKEVLFRIGGKTGSRKDRLLNFLTLKKIYLQAAFIVVIMIAAGAFYMKYPTVAPTPSAIVNYVEGDASSVMIFETRNEKHTVIWYTET